MDKFQALQLFVRVVENGSFSISAKEASLSQATVSKQVNELERFLKTKLLSRTTRRLHLTEAGERFYREAKLVLEQFDHAVGEVQNLRQQPAGTLRIAAALMFGRRQITPLLPRFMELYPDIIIEHYLSDSETDLIQEGIDLSLRMGELRDSSYQARKIAMTRGVTVASPSFLEKYGEPKHPHDLERMPCLVFLGRQSAFEWRYTDNDGRVITAKVTGPYRANASEAIREAALAGLGVFRSVLSASGQDIEDGRLVSILKDYKADNIPIYAVMPASAYVPQKTRVFVEFLAEEFKRKPWFANGD